LRDCNHGQGTRVGAAKTRLVPPLSAAEAAGLSACFIRDATENIAAAAKRMAIKGYLAYSPPDAEAEFGPLLAEGIRLLPSHRMIQVSDGTCGR
jgi:hypothetical protein